MTKLYLITGFLGAGKTTFLKKFLRVLGNPKVQIIVNEYGKEGIDGQLLKETGAALNEINNGSIFCSCRLDMFEAVLSEILKDAPEMLLIEASGLSDPTNIRKILDQPGKYDDIEYMGAICLVDARNFHKVYETATVVKKQISISDMILLNKIDLVPEEKLSEIEETIWNHRPDISIYRTTYGEMKPEWLEALHAGTGADVQGKIQARDITLRSFNLEIEDNFTAYEFRKFVEMFLENTYRVKGFVRLEGRIYHLDCVGTLFRMELWEKEAQGINNVVILSGNKLPVKGCVEKAMEWYPGKVKSFARC